MSFGKKKSKQVKIKAPPRITQVDHNSPLGDRFTTRISGNRQVSDSQLSPFTQGLVQQSQRGLNNLADALARPDQERAADIRRRGDDLFSSLSQGINRDADDLLSKARSGLSKRFGGSLNSTFGNDMLARLEENRLRELGDARRQASLLGEELSQADENSRLRRFNVFLGYLNSLNDQASGLGSVGSSLLLNETRRASDIALARAKLLDSAKNRQSYNLNTRLNLVRSLLPTGNSLWNNAGSFFGKDNG